MTSPNYLTTEYPHNLDSVQKIQVPEGNTILMWFDSCEVEMEHDTVYDTVYDTVTITDKDGTTLRHLEGDWRCGAYWLEEIISKTNMVEVRFRTDGSGSGRGWRLNWGKFNVSKTIILDLCVDRNNRR